MYYFYVPGLVKTMIDRRLPLTLPDIIPDPERPGLTKHPPRYDLSGQRNVLVSTCGFYKPDGIYGDVISLFDRLYGKGKYETIFCGEGELFRVPPMKPRIDEYLSYARCAGKEFANGAISVQTKGKLQELLLAQDRFEKMANTSWKQ